MKLYLFIILSFFSFLYKCNNPDKEKYPVKGVDISHHQGTKIDWEELKKKKVEFVYIKATEGRDFQDKLFTKNWEAAARMKIRRGAYHFFIFCKNGKEQAKNFKQTVLLDSMDLPPVLDLEFSGGECKKQPMKQEDLIHEIERFLLEVEEHYCVKPIIYTTNDFYQQYLLNSFQLYDIWIRDVLKEPKLADEREWTFWQYKVDTLKGLNGEVDMNVFNGTKEEFMKLKGYNCYQ
ncbi:MAG: GH25 family lysozyme [Bacteroidia bacterium]